MKMRKLQLSAGFTLIEILIVLAITTVLFTFLISYYFQVNDVTSIQSERSQISQKVSSTMKMVRKDLNNLVTDKWHLPKPNSIDNVKNIFTSKQDPKFSRRGDAINFLSSKLYVNTMMLSSQVFNVTYFCKYNEQKDSFTIYRRENIFADYELPIGGVSVPVANNVHSFYFEFSNDGKTWEKQEWDYNVERRYPLYVAINIEFQIESGKIYKFREIVSPPILWL